MSEEIELAAKSVGESAGALAEVSGVLGPVQELADWVTSFIHYRRQPALAKQVMKAAEKIRAAGLPSETVSDKLLRDLLEGGSMEDDESMQEQWANLLANAMTESSAKVARAFPKILSELEPVEARILDAMADGKGTFLGAFSGTRMAHGQVKSLPLNGLPNLERLDLIGIRQNMIAPTRYPVQTTPDADRMRVIGLTPFGVGFVEACRPPKTAATDAETSDDETRETTG
jgi:hypothetical protein